MNKFQLIESQIFSGQSYSEILQPANLRVCHKSVSSHTFCTKSLLWANESDFRYVTVCCFSVNINLLATIEIFIGIYCPFGLL